MNIDISNTDNKYGIIYTDPPWQQSKGGFKKSRPNSTGVSVDYPTMSVSEIKELHKIIFDNLVEEDHNVFMWVIDKYLIEAEQFMNELGYTRHARFVWDKVTGMAPAFTVRFCHEYLLWFYKKGHLLKPCNEMRGKYSTVMREQVTAHSKKPLCAYEMIDNMFPDVKKLELFARNEYKDWDCWGNQTDMFKKIE